MGILAQIQGIEKGELYTELENNFEFSIVLLGDPGVGKSSLVVKLINNYQDSKSSDDSINSISQEITKKLLFQ